MSLFASQSKSASYAKTKLFVPESWNGLLIVGDCPYNEMSTEFPFMHSHLGALETLCKKGGIDQTRTAFANILSFYPRNGYFSTVDQPVLNEELKQLWQIIDLLKPKFIIGLGRQTGRYLKTGLGDLEEERGAPFRLNGVVPTILTFHPKEIFRQYEFYFIAIADFAKAARLLRDGWSPSEYSINYLPTFRDACLMLHKFIETKCALSVDIETEGDDPPRITCVGLAYSGTSAIVIPFRKLPYARYWPEAEERVIWRLLAKCLETCPLLGQNAVHFDHRVLAQHKILPNFVNDTMFAQWELYCELPKSLAFINSLYLDEPYHKDMLKLARSGKIPYEREFEYCGIDCVKTFAGAVEMKKEFAEYPPKAYEHYRFNIRVSRAFQYMTLRGVLFDVEKRKQRLSELRAEADKMEVELWKYTGPNFNVRSPKQVNEWLYTKLRLPPRYKEVKDEEGDVDMRETGDYLTMLKLAYEFEDKPELMLAARLRKLKKRISSLDSIDTYSNNFVTWEFNGVGTVSGRAAGYKPWNGKGAQPQNVDRRDRDLFLAGFDPIDGELAWLKADLEGADSWTVAALLQALGDSRMMEDLLGGVKPAQALTISQFFGKDLIHAPTHVLASYKKQLKEVLKKEEATRGPGRTTYDAMKAVSHGSNYMMGAQTTHDNIFKKTEGDLYIPVEACKAAQRLYMMRYGKLEDLQEKMFSILKTYGYLDAFSGTRRHFYGRRDNQTVREMMSQLPQAHTTFVINQILDRVMNWERNRMADNINRLLLRPVNQVHDDINLLFPLARIDEARERFHVMRQNRLECWGVTFSIPMEANYGPSWGQAKEDF